MQAFRRFLSLLLLYCCFDATYAQTPIWLHASGGSSGNDQARVCHIAPDGNLYVAGKFSGIIDLDPSAATHLIVSNGREDLFLAAYTPQGGLLWGFGTGGPDNDMVYDMVIDASSNIYITGYFKGANVDFNPSAAQFLLSDNGLPPGTPSVGGDGFVAKYSSSGSFLWAHNLGGVTTQDLGESLYIDRGGNLYVGGIFSGTMDIDPSGNVYPLTSTDGIGYVVKYTPSGSLVWGKVIGVNSVWAIKGDATGNLYLTGAYTGIGSDFDPSAGTYYLTATGIYDAYLAKYDTALNLVYAKGHGGAALDECYNMDIDEHGDVYLSGSTLSPSMSFGNIAANASGAGENMYVVKYSASGQALWGYVFGGDNNDKARAFIKDSVVYVTGYFSNDIDFDPSPATATLSSNGGLDIFLSTYDLDGNYICGINFGGNAHDQGVAVAWDQQGYFYLGGDFSASTDFDPRPSAALNKNSNGSRDLFIGKYYLPSIAPLPDGYLRGDTVCMGQQASLQFIATSGLGPFTIIYTNGSQRFTLENITDSTFFALNPNPLQTTTYTLIAIAQPDICNKSASGLTRPVLVLVVNPEISVTKSNDIGCVHAMAVLQAEGGLSYAWQPGNLSGANIQVSPTTTTRYAVVGTDAYGCMDSASIDVFVSGEDRFNITLPQAFTPNGDGKNDCLRTISTETFSNFEWSIYNRWGERVFYSVNAGDCWDGRFHGTPQDMGTYYYFFKAVTPQCGEVWKKGDVHLLR